MRDFGAKGCKALAGLTIVTTLTVSGMPAFAKTYSIFEPTRLSAHPISVQPPALNGPFLGTHDGDSLPRLASFSLRGNSRQWLGKATKARYGGGQQCVPFARNASGIEIRGNAAHWWDAAQGVYQRGSRPEYGSVLNFRATGRMRLGHVAVVTAILDSRQIEIEHANWAGPSASRGGISRNISVIDVSPRNDWSAVRVSLGRSGSYGSVYPTYGFIYDRPEHGTMEANAAPGSRFARSSAVAASYDEVAQAPEPRRGTMDMFDSNTSADVPNRGIR